MFSRDQVLAGLPAKRASTLLFAIEGETARLVAASRINRAGFIGERTAAEQERDFFKALSTGGALPKPPTIADLERFARDWARHVPDEPGVRAALARLLGAKYRFRRDDVPGIRRALGLDGPDIAEAFGRLHGAPLAGIYALELPVRDRLRWMISGISGRFDRLPAFWIAFFLALTEVLAEGILALPLALAGLGPLPGVVLLLIFGLINLITMAAMAESVIRNGSMRYGVSYIARLVTELLGRVPASVLGVVFAIDGVLTIWFYFLGFGSVLAGATGVPVAAWIALLFLANVWVLRKETLDDTIASAVIIGTTTLVLLVAITALALVNVDPANLVAAPSAGSGPDVRAVGLIFGVVLMAFFGHTSAANSAKLLLTIEPTGRSLLWGNLAAMATVIGLYCIATFAIIGAVGAEPLLTTTGTAITPLADAIGPSVNVMGVLYVGLAIGIGSLYATLGIYNQVVELLPGVSTGRRGWLSSLSTTRRRRLLAGFAPTALVCLALELAVLAGHDNFADVVAFAGTLTVPIIAGIFPLLLIVAARRRGEYVPGVVIRLVGHPLTIAILVPLFVIGMAVHAVIWERPVERAAALVASGIAIVVVIVAWRSGILRRRAIVELRVDERRDRTTVSVTGDGQVVVAERVLDGSEAGGADVDVDVPAGPWHELRPWLHRVNADGWSVGLAGVVRLSGTVQEDVLVPSDEEPLVVPIDGQASTARIRFSRD